LLPECSLLVHISPGARKNQVVGITSDGVTKIKISAPPVEGKANLGLKKYLSLVLAIPVSKIEIERGEKSRNKLVKITGIAYEDAIKRLKFAAGEIIF
jgi:uncharacterized protein (TIGR00251 family)